MAKWRRNKAVKKPSTRSPKRMYNPQEGEIWVMRDYSMQDKKDNLYYYLLLEHCGIDSDEPLFKMLCLDTGDTKLYYMNFDLDDWRET